MRNHPQREDPRTSEVLNWYLDGYRAAMGFEESYRAPYPWAASFMKDEYSVYPWKGGWAYSRPDHPTLGKFTGRVTSLDAAKSLCEADFAKQVRLRAWHVYMLANVPPLVGNQP